MKHITWHSFVRYWKWGVRGVLLHPRELWRWRRLFYFTYSMLRRGFTEGDVWNLDCTITEFVLPRLELFRNNYAGIPADLAEAEYKEILDKMLLAFRLIQKIETSGALIELGDDEKIENGLELFGRYFRSLWN